MVVFSLVGSLTAQAADPGAGQLGQSGPTGPVLQLKDFLQQVEKGNQSIQSLKDSSKGAEFRSVEGELILSPTAFANFQYSDDQRQTMAPAFQGTQNEVRIYSLGVKKLTTFGLQAQLAYNIIDTSLTGVNPSIVPQSNYLEARPVLELTQSLWRNGFGRETRAKKEIIESQALATSFNDSYQVKTALSNAEVAYWKLQLARENVRVQRESLDRFERMRDLYLRRSKLGLSDRADLLQSEASVQSQRLQLQGAIDDELVFARNFNTLRGVDSNEVAEKLESITPTLISQMTVPQRAQFRDNVKSAQYEEKVAIGNSVVGSETNSPTLELFASLSLNGRDSDYATAVGRSFTTQYPWNSVGFRFSAPLDVGNLSKAREGYALGQQSADLKLHRAYFDQERQWINLNKRFTESKNRLELARSVESTQKEKLFYEKERLSRGRTTTFQVIKFEEDYSKAQLSHIQVQAIVLEVVAEMKTFVGGGTQ
jgi:outer membrane protein TolC